MRPLYALENLIVYFSGDLAYLRGIRRFNDNRHVIFVAVDCFSRLCYLSLLRSGKSVEVTKELEKSFHFFGAVPHKFVSDKGPSPVLYGTV